jgi:hypothetical protein
MKPGYYVARVRRNNTQGDNLKLESVLFGVTDQVDAEEALRRARDWQGFVAKSKPKAEIVVVKVLPQPEEAA